MRHRRYSHAGALVAFILGLSAWLVPASPAAADFTTIAMGNGSPVRFITTRVGTWVDDVRIVSTNFIGDDVTVSGFQATGGNVDDFWLVDSNCLAPDGGPKTYSHGGTCTSHLMFLPTAHGERSTGFSLISDASNPETVTLTGTATLGYYIAGAAGQVAGFGDAVDYGDASDEALLSPVVGITTTPTGEGYWLAAEDGGVFSYGVAGFHGSMGGKPLNQPIVGMAATPSGQGYWLVASDGGIFTFGDAGFHGSMGGKPLNQPIVGMSASPTGAGYWMVALDGGIFTFGDAGFHNSMGGKPLNQPMVAMAPTPSGAGYHTVARDGGMFSFGDARFFGSMGGKPLNQPMIGMAEYPTGEGYWTVADDGGIFTFGKAPFYGSLGGQGIDDVIAMTGTAPPVDLSFFSAVSASASTDGDDAATLRRGPLPADRRVGR